MRRQRYSHCHSQLRRLHAVIWVERHKWTDWLKLASQSGSIAANEFNVMLRGIIDYCFDLCSMKDQGEWNGEQER